MTGVYALIVAAGRGARLGHETPKQYLDLGGRPVLAWSAARLKSHPEIAGVAVVIHPDDRLLYETACAGLDLLPPAVGGATRQESVRNGLIHLTSHDPDAVLIHDAARPFVDEALISRVIAGLETADGALAALPVADTLKRADSSGETSAETVARAGLWRAQTPQGFRFVALMAAHEAARASGRSDFTDDAAIAEAAGLTVKLVPGSEDNFKVTTSDDFDRARRMCERDWTYRTGQGFDVHRFETGDHVWLCGIRIAHSAGLKGHSDADAGLHAATDALLGAIAAGDIGDHFPPSDEAWRDASSDRFLAHAAELVRARGGEITGLDLTLICEAPRIGPHRAAMARRVAEILAIAPDQVGIKATTTEGLGFTGRGEGIAAQAVATVRLPRTNRTG